MSRHCEIYSTYADIVLSSFEEDILFRHLDNMKK